MNDVIRERTTFENQRGEQLAAALELPASAPPTAFACFAHCFTCGKDNAAAGRIGRALCRRGIGVLRFDFTGLGNSGGDFANENFSSNVEDLVAAADFLRQQHRAPQLLVGHSLGGAAALVAAPRIDEVRAVATIGAPSDVSHLKQLFDAQLPTIEREGRAMVTLAGRRFAITRQLIDDVSQQRLNPLLASLRRALLVIHSPRDSVVGIEHAGRIFQRAKHPKSFLSLDDADHLLSRRRDAEYVAHVLAAWTERYLQ